MAVAFDRGGFWVAWENGLEHFRYADGRAVSDRVAVVPAQWQSRDILGMRADREDRLWLFATQGLWRFDPASGAFTRFGSQDGLLGGEFNNDRTAMLANGMIYGATKGGVVGFSPELLAARLGAARRHMRLAVPPHEGERPAEVADGGHPLGEGRPRRREAVG